MPDVTLYPVSAEALQLWSGWLYEGGDRTCVCKAEATGAYQGGNKKAPAGKEEKKEAGACSK